MVAFTLQIEDTINHMLEQAGTSHDPFFSYVADQEDNCALLLGQANHIRGYLAQLIDASGDSVQLLLVKRLHRVDHKNVRFYRKESFLKFDQPCSGYYQGIRRCF